MLIIIELTYFFLFFSFVNCQRYYAYIETLFVIDKQYFPDIPGMSYEEYIQVMVDTTNIIFQSQNDLDIRFEMIVSSVQYVSSLIQPRDGEPYEYESALRGQIKDYDKYDSVVLLNYQPWKGPRGAQGYASLKGVCNPSYKIMYILPYQNAPFYLAHEFGHQLGLEHQVKTSCYTSSHMSVMTLAHTNSYEHARWTSCDNQYINSHICEFSCLFNKPDNYKIVKNKYSTMPGSRMNNDLQAKMIEAMPTAIGLMTANTYKPTDYASRCLYFHYFTDSSGGYRSAYSPMLPGSTCGENMVCHKDKCVQKSEVDSLISNVEYETNTLDLTNFCKAPGTPSELTASNKDPKTAVQCVNWEDDFMCKPSSECPAGDDEEFVGLYVRHICCAKCSNDPGAVSAMFGDARRNSIHTRDIVFVIILSFFFF